MIQKNREILEKIFWEKLYPKKLASPDGAAFFYDKIISRIESEKIALFIIERKNHG